MAEEKKVEGTPEVYHGTPEAIDLAPPLEDHQKTRWERSWPVIACGAGLFSDGKAFKCECRTFGIVV